MVGVGGLVVGCLLLLFDGLIIYNMYSVSGKGREKAGEQRNC